MRVTTILIIINIAVFAMQVLSETVTEMFALTPALALSGYFYQFITYMFLHGGPFHLFFNMFVLGIFGFAVERELGFKFYTFLYIVSGLGAAFLYIALTVESTFLIPMLGASGAVFGILAAYGFLFPRRWIIMFPGIPMPAIAAVMFFGAIELFSGVFNLGGNIANFGHLGGLITSVILMIYWKYFYKKRKVFGEFEFIWE